MATEIILSAGTSSDILALQRTTAAIEIAQKRLSTGLKVGSAIDDSIAYFTSQTLSNRAADLLTLKDDIDQAVTAANTAVTGLESINDIVEQMKGLAQSAKRL